MQKLTDYVITAEAGGGEDLGFHNHSEIDVPKLKGDPDNIGRHVHLARHQSQGEDRTDSRRGPDWVILEQLKLANFRGFEQIDLKFDPRVTVIASINGAGTSAKRKGLS